MANRCPLCGREKLGNEKYCEYCQHFICELCGERLSKGYCAICGSLICEEDSKMVGYARICKRCLKKYPELENPLKLKNFVKERSKFFTKFTKPKPELLIKVGDINQAKKEVFMFIGIDDTDSPYGMCTTLVGAKLAYFLIKLVKFVDYPRLVRLNPNIPSKTRGNASISLRFLTSVGEIENVIEKVLEVVSRNTHVEFKKTSTVVSFYINTEYAINKQFYEIYKQAVKDVITPRMVIEKIKNITKGALRVYTFGKENGIVGSISAIGAIFNDYTFELLAYRKEESYGKERIIDINTVIDMDKKFRKHTFNNIYGSRMLIAPKGPDPVLFGIRGDLPDKLIEAFLMLKHEDISLWCLYKTNQGTGEHIIEIDDIEEARPYQTISFSAIVKGIQKEDDKVILNSVKNGWDIKIYVYKPHKYLRGFIEKLEKGDELKIVGNVTKREDGFLEINLEEFKPLFLMPKEKMINPICPKCGKTMKKKGENYYKCKNCKFTINYDRKLVILEKRTDLQIGKRYLPPPTAHRHLTMPQSREEFRALKLSGKLKIPLIKPFVGKNKKGLKISKADYVDEPRII